MLLNEHAHQIWVDEEWRMDVTDEKGLILFTIHVSTQESAASQGSRRRPTLDDVESR